MKKPCVLLFLVFAFAFGEGGGGMEKAAAEINGRLPIMIDEKTRWDRFEIKEGSAVYTYTLTDPSAEGTFYTQEDRQAIIDLIKSSPSLRQFRDSNLTLQYLFNGSDGRKIFSLAIAPDELGFR
jgi:hypothetical protein